MMGFDLLDWGRQGVLSDLNELATKQGWDKVVPPALQKFSKFNGKWIAVPVNIHSTNWVWANKEALAKAGVTSDPGHWTWDDFIAAAQPVQKAGFTPSAPGGQPWAEGTIFGGLALAPGGPRHSRRALIRLDGKALNS